MIACDVNFTILLAYEVQIFMLLMLDFWEII